MSAKVNAISFFFSLIATQQRCSEVLTLVHVSPASIPELQKASPLIGGCSELYLSATATGTAN